MAQHKQGDKTSVSVNQASFALRQVVHSFNSSSYQIALAYSCRSISVCDIQYHQG